MDLQLNENQKLLVESAQRFFDRSYPLERIREIFLLNDAVDPALWREISDLGWNAVALPEDVGGFDGGQVDALLLLIEMGRAGCLTPYAHSSVAAALAILPYDKGIAAEIANSQMVVIPVPLTATDKPPVIANGKLTVDAGPVTWAGLATHLLCETHEDAWLVKADPLTIDIQRLASSRGEPLYAIEIHSAEATKIGRSGAVFDAIRDYGAFACAGLMQGLCERALELSVAYAKERIQFGRPIGSFQAIQHKAADMRIATEVGRVLVLRAAAEHDAKRFSAAASKAKAWTGDAARKVTREAMQIFGGVSFAGDHPIQLLFQAVLTLSSQYDAAYQHRECLAADLLD